VKLSSSTEIISSLVNQKYYLTGYETPPLSAVFTAFVLVCIAGISEEVFFEGFLLHNINSYFIHNPWITALITSSLFGLGQYPFLTIDFFLKTFLGLVFATAFINSDYNLIAPIVVHVVYDIMTFIPTWISELQGKKN